MNGFFLTTRASAVKTPNPSFQILVFNNWIDWNNWNGWNPRKAVFHVRDARNSSMARLTSAGLSAKGKWPAFLNFRYCEPDTAS